MFQAVLKNSRIKYGKKFLEFLKLNVQLLDKTPFHSRMEWINPGLYQNVGMTASQYLWSHLPEMMVTHLQFLSWVWMALAPKTYSASMQGCVNQISILIRNWFHVPLLWGWSQVFQLMIISVKCVWCVQVRFQLAGDHFTTTYYHSNPA